MEQTAQLRHGVAFGNAARKKNRPEETPQLDSTFFALEHERVAKVEVSLSLLFWHYKVAEKAGSPARLPQREALFV